MFFLILPLMQTITQPRNMDMELQGIDTANIPPPPPPPEPEQEEEKEEEPPPPELAEEAPPLDLSQLELALNPGFGDGWMAGDFAVKLNAVASQDDALDAVFSMADLDQKPRVIYQPGPTLDAAARRKAPGTVYILFIVDQRGRVENPVVQQSTDPVFEKAALAAVKQWKFEPGKRNGQSVRFRMRVPVTFPKG
jgi:protein TonB